MRGKAWNRPAARVSGCWNSTGDLGEEHLARRQLGQRLDLVRGDDPLAEQAALQDERFVVLAELAQRLGRRGGVAVHERDRHRALEQVGDLVEPAALDRPTGQRVLEHLVLGAAGRSDARSSASSWTVSPRYSVSTAASDSSSLVRISSTTATFSGLAIWLPLAETDRDVTADTRDVPSGARAPRPAGACSRWPGGAVPITSKRPEVCGR